MKSIIFLVLSLVSVSSFAFMDMPSATDYPSENDWTVAMISMACDVQSESLKGLDVSSNKVASGIIYTAKQNGKVVAQAWASNGTIFAAKQCIKLN